LLFESIKTFPDTVKTGVGVGVGVFVGVGVGVFVGVGVGVFVGVGVGVFVGVGLGAIPKLTVVFGPTVTATGFGVVTWYPVGIVIVTVYEFATILVNE
jgi:hypothetical protein